MLKSNLILFTWIDCSVLSCSKDALIGLNASCTVNTSNTLITPPITSVWVIVYCSGVKVVAPLTIANVKYRPLEVPNTALKPKGDSLVSSSATKLAIVGEGNRPTIIVMSGGPIGLPLVSLIVI